MQFPNFTPEQTSLFSQLSGSLFDKLSRNSPMFAQMLSAAQAMQELSAAACHPYEKMKIDLFGKDYKFPTIDDIEVPNDFNLDVLTEGIKRISKQIQTTSLSSVSAFAGFASDTENNSIENFNINIPENTISPDLARKNIEFSEIVKSLTVDRLKEQPLEIAKKLISHFEQLYR